MSDKNVFDFSARRQENIEQKKRSFERVVFQEFLGVYSVVDDNGTGLPVSFVDISKDGCQFQLPFSPKAKNQFRPGQEVTLKIFFTKGSFLPAVVKIKHATEYIDKNGDAFWRCGGEFDSTLPSFKALSTFVQFIYQYAEFSCLDRGDGKVYFL